MIPYDFFKYYYYYFSLLLSSFSEMTFLPPLQLMSHQHIFPFHNMYILYPTIFPSYVSNTIPCTALFNSRIYTHISRFGARSHKYSICLMGFELSHQNTFQFCPFTSTLHDFNFYLIKLVENLERDGYILKIKKDKHIKPITARKE